MEFRDLGNVSIGQLVECLVESFQGYFIEMPSDVDYWESRFENARVDKSLSFGVFDNNKLVGFIIHAVDEVDGILTAYNTGTGVLPKYRGLKLVDKMYGFGLPTLKNYEIQKCTLEVIDQNTIAHKVYQRIGFTDVQKLYCFAGEINSKENTNIKKVELDQIKKYASNHNYTWDNQWKTIQKARDTYEVYTVQNNNEIGYFIINPKNGYLAQIESKAGEWENIFSGISQIQKKVKIINIKENRVSLISYLKNSGFNNTINQIEMEMKIPS